MSAAATRRDALLRALVAGGAMAAPALLRPAVAAAQEDDPPGLEDFLVEAVVLEQIAALAYATAAGELGGDRALRRTLERFERQEQIHVTALRSALDSLGAEAPDAPGAPDDRGAIEGVEGLDAERAEELADLLAELGEARGRQEQLELLARIEDEQIAFYLREAPALEAEDILRTGVEIAACQAQHAAVLREALGRPPAEAVAEPAAAKSERG